MKCFTLNICKLIPRQFSNGAIHFYPFFLDLAQCDVLITLGKKNKNCFFFLISGIKYSKFEVKICLKN